MISVVNNNNYNWNVELLPHIKLWSKWLAKILGNFSYNPHDLNG